MQVLWSFKGGDEELAVINQLLPLWRSCNQLLEPRDAREALAGTAGERVAEKIEIKRKELV